MLVIPGEVRYLLSRLEQKGYEGYSVGGCVRDALLGLTPKIGIYALPRVRKK